MTDTIYNSTGATLYDREQRERLVNGLERTDNVGWAHYVRRLSVNDDRHDEIVSDIQFVGREGETGRVYTPYYIFHFHLDIEWDALHGDIESGFHHAPACDVYLTMIEERVTGSLLWEGSERLEYSFDDDIPPIDVDALVAAEDSALDEMYSVEQSL
jgi:hypothetical protein